jgi:hypothetical protein
VSLFSSHVLFGCVFLVVVQHIIKPRGMEDLDCLQSAIHAATTMVVVGLGSDDPNFNAKLILKKKN